ncbi:Gp49 family protein [Roseococcus sp.]|uniref:Gp49 family protein n=1 Tax=Roseococcus sp. TaxID=2109646 RepID=UPI003BA979FC
MTLQQVNDFISSEHYFTARDGALGAFLIEAGAITKEGETPLEPGTEMGMFIPAPLELLTFCVLVLANGFTVTGQGVCADPANFDAQMGRDLARKDAVNKIWPLLGFELRTKLAAFEQAAALSGETSERLQ